MGAAGSAERRDDYGEALKRELEELRAELAQCQARIVRLEAALAMRRMGNTAA